MMGASGDYRGAHNGYVGHRGLGSPGHGGDHHDQPAGHGLRERADAQRNAGHPAQSEGDIMDSTTRSARAIAAALEAQDRRRAELAAQSAVASFRAFGTALSELARQFAAAMQPVIELVESLQETPKGPAYPGTAVGFPKHGRVR